MSQISGFGFGNQDNDHDQSSIPFQNDDQQDSIADNNDSILGLFQKNQGKESLRVFKEILWVYEEDQKEEARNKIFAKNLEIIYGQCVRPMCGQANIIKYLTQKQQKIKTLQLLVYKNTQNPKLVPVYLLLCKPRMLPFCQSNLLSLPHVYNQCILFRSPEDTKNKDHIYGNIMQIYDIINVVATLEQYLLGKHGVDLYEMYEMFNLKLDPNVVVREAQRDNEGEEREQEEEQGSRRGFRGNKKQQRESESEGQDQDQDQEERRQLQMLEQAHQKHYQQSLESLATKLTSKIEQKIVSDLLSTSFSITLDATEYTFIILTTESTKQHPNNSQSQIFVLKTKQELQQFIVEQQNCPNIILISSQLHKLEEILDSCEKVRFWVRCLWGRDELEGKDREQYDEMFGNFRQMHESYQGRVIDVETGIEEMGEKLEKLQMQIQQELDQ